MMLLAAGEASHLAGPDYFILAGYFVVMLGIGAYFWRHMKGMRAYFSGHNQIPWWLSGVSFYMTSFSAFLFVAYSEVAYRYGLVAVTLGSVAIPAVVIGSLFFASRWRRARIDSPVEYLEERYSLGLRQAFGWANIPVRMIDNGLRLYATGLFIAGVAGIPLTDSICYCGFVTLAYTFAGGLWAVTVTDFVQFVVMMAGAVLLVPLALARIGGLGGLVSGSPPGFFHPLQPAQYPWTFLLAWFLVVLCNYNTSFGLVQRYYCVRDEREARKVGLFVAFLILVGTPLFFLPAMAARQFLPDADPKSIYATLCTTLLPSGVLGLIIAAMFSATMSSLSGDYNGVAAVLTNDVYKRLVDPKAAERRLVLVGRLATFLVGLIPLGIALYVAGHEGSRRLFDKMVTVFSVAGPPIAIPMLAGIVWHRASNWGATAGFLTGVTVGLGVLFKEAIKAAVVTIASLDSNSLPSLLQPSGAPSVQMLAFTTVTTTLLVMVVVSLLRPARGDEKRRSEGFVERLRTPVPPVVAVSGSVPAPFRVVGVCTVMIAVMLLAVQPFMGWNAGSKTNLLIVVILLVPGVYWIVRARQKAAPSEQVP